ncbi:unnamed protein product [Ambrosiozyma monospora]|uniref:Unnamed protein product n=1 Tax=Ambrosiozyma monospora TaxID=43982 RepID=A0ACB5U939_AMBMO|nr:unnamed protein product [Ambrosiozyma monospora]
MPLSCTVCRKRKVKCDRGRPHCQVCEKYKVTHLCHYQEPSWANTNNDTSPKRSHSQLEGSFSSETSDKRQKLNDLQQHNPPISISTPSSSNSAGVTNTYQKYNTFNTPLNYMGNLSVLNHLGSNERSHVQPVNSNTRSEGRLIIEPFGSSLPPTFGRGSSHILSSDSRSSSSYPLPSIGNV